MNETMPTSYPSGEYAIVELFGHTTLVGRITEVERFGAKMLAIEPLFRGELLGIVLHGGAAIYRLTPCSAEVAHKKQATDDWQLPLPIRAILPPALLNAPVPGAAVDQEPLASRHDDPGDDWEDTTEDYDPPQE